MGAIVNGLALHGLRGYGATFLIFSDYMRGVDPARRADGAAVDLRLHPRLDRPRRGRPDPPADRAARRAARDAQHHGHPRPPTPTRPRSRGAYASPAQRRPPCSSLSRQGAADAGPGELSPTTRSSAAPTCCATLRAAPPDLILIAHRHRGPDLPGRRRRCWRPTGSPARVVSMPCMERFAGPAGRTASACCRRGCRARVAVEAASPFGWDRWVGRRRRGDRDGGLRRLGTGERRSTRTSASRPARIVERGRAAVQRAKETDRDEHHPRHERQPQPARRWPRPAPPLARPDPPQR